VGQLTSYLQSPGPALGKFGQRADLGNLECPGKCDNVSLLGFGPKGCRCVCLFCFFHSSSMSSCFCLGIGSTEEQKEKKSLVKWIPVHRSSSASEAVSKSQDGQAMASAVD
jgi:hypothetical protein